MGIKLNSSRFWAGVVCCVVLGLAMLSSSQTSRAAGVTSRQYQSGVNYLKVEVLRDDLLHFEAATGSVSAGAIWTSPMVFKTDYTGPTIFTELDANHWRTAKLDVAIDVTTLCATVVEYQPSTKVLGSFCPQDLAVSPKKLVIGAATMQHAYGLGEQFPSTPGTVNGDWTGQKRTPGNANFGNAMVGYNGGAVGNAQFPVLYAVGNAFDNFALFLDSFGRQTWDLRSASWSVTTYDQSLRWYVFTGPNLKDLRSDYLELTGRPPVPPKKFFGLWVSEYGYDNWAEMEGKLTSLRANKFPIDGFVLDLQWFGGIEPTSTSQMGSLAWDTTKFPNPAAKIAALESNDGIGIIPIEEAYVASQLSTYTAMSTKGYLVTNGQGGAPVNVGGWWASSGSMVDFTNTTGADYWHDNVRQHLITEGVVGHWTDLGEPEIFNANGWYAGIPGTTLHAHVDNHNYYNFAWAQSMARGYQRNNTQARLAILARSGTSGIQRFGVGMWSGDIGANYANLSSQQNVQMEMSMSGIDYFGSDIGGFHRGNFSGTTLTPLYTAWFGTSSLLDVPVRPHVMNTDNSKETAPDRVGDLASNLANIRLRYELVPYLYSLAHRAYSNGEPVFPPMVYHFQDDVNVRESADQKMIGQYLLMRTATGQDDTALPVYLPGGEWFDYYTDASVSGSQTAMVQRNGLYRPPLYARAGGIIPQMLVDDKTMNVFGKRTDGSSRNELIVRVYASGNPTDFTLYEDDGRTIAYQSGAIRSTLLTQQLQSDRAQVTIAAATGTYAGAPANRNNVVRLTVKGQNMTLVTVNGSTLTQVTSKAALDAAASGWWQESANVVWAKSGDLPVTTAKAFEFRFTPPVSFTATPNPTMTFTPAPTPTNTPFGACGGGGGDNDIKWNYLYHSTSTGTPTTELVPQENHPFIVPQPDGSTWIFALATADDTSSVTLVTNISGSTNIPMSCHKRIQTTTFRTQTTSYDLWRAVVPPQPVGTTFTYQFKFVDGTHTAHAPKTGGIFTSPSGQSVRHEATGTPYSYTTSTSPTAAPATATATPSLVVPTLTNTTAPTATPFTVTVTPSSAVLSGHIEWQGRPAQADPSRSLPITLEFVGTGTTGISLTRSAVTDQNGNFSVAMVPAGSYDVYIKQVHTLRAKISTSFGSSDSATLPTVTLLEGDVDNNNVVDLIDWSVLVTNYTKCVGSVGYNAGANLNERGCVDLNDVTLLIANYGKMGD